MPTFTGTAGGDFIDTDFVSAGVIAVGALRPGPGVDTIDAGAGNDVIQDAGGAGNDLILAGTGDDFVSWFQGEGSDSIDGGAGTDEVMFQTGTANDTFNLTASGTVVSARIDGAETVTMNNVEHLLIATWDGADAINIADMSGTAVTTVDITLQAFSSFPDLAADTITMAGSGGNDVIQIFQMGPTSEEVWTNFANGHNMAVNIDTIETADRTVFNLGAGDDTLWAWPTTALGQLTVNGQDGNDFMFGTSGPETMTGGNGADTIQNFGGGDSLSGDAGDDSIQSFSTTGGDTLAGGGGNDSFMVTGGGDSISGGANDDVVHWQFEGPLFSLLATTTVDGGAGADTFALDDSTNGVGGWAFVLGASAGGHASLTMTESAAVFGGSIVYNSAGFDLANVETVHITGTGDHNGGGGSSGLAAGDFVSVGDLSGTAIRLVDIDLGHSAAFPTAPDFVSDEVVIAGRTGADTVAASVVGGALKIAGLAATITIENVDSQDMIFLDGGAGNDRIDLSADTNLPFQHIIHGGAGNDTIIGSAFATAPGALAELLGDAGNDSIAGGLGTSLISGGDGNDTISTIGGAHSTGIVVYSGFAGSDVITDFHAHTPFRDGGDVLWMDVAEHSFVELKADGHMVQSGADVIITDSTHIIVTLKNISLASLTATDFLF